MRNVWLLLALMVFPSFVSEPLVKTKVSEGITVSIPAKLFPMTPEDIAQRYPSVRAPLGAYTNEDRMVDFSVNISATRWPDENLEMAKGFFRSSLFNLYDRVDMIHEGIVTVHKKKYIYFEFESRINGDKRKEGYQDPIMKYTYIQYLIIPGRTLVFTFTCPRDQRNDWELTARQVMQSIRVHS